MLQKHLENEILKRLGFEPTSGQRELIEGLAAFCIGAEGTEHCLLVKGYAGTGKTTTMAAFVQTLSAFEQSFMLLAPTGRAAKVLSEYAGHKAYTIHRCIYRQKSSADGLGQFDLNFNKHTHTTFIIDEASMLSNSGAENNAFGSGCLLSDLIEFVSQGNGCRLIFVGDTAQLPPIGTSLSPALSASELNYYGLKPQEFTLTEVIRQQSESGILHNATLLRRMLDDNRIEQPKFRTEGFSDISRISSAELLECLETAYSRVGREENTVICYSNKRANMYNKGIRGSILGIEEELCPGDLLMVARNSYFWAEQVPELNLGFIANGDIVEVVRLGKHHEQHGFRFVDATIRLIDSNNAELDVRLMLDTLTVEGPSLSADDMKRLYLSVAEDYAHLRTKKERVNGIKTDPFYNAIQVKFAYAVTCHKAQGGQWRNVFVDQGFFRPEMLTKEYLRWLYTAITRASEKLYLVNFKDEFFEGA